VKCPPAEQPDTADTARQWGVSGSAGGGCGAGTKVMDQMQKVVDQVQKVMEQPGVAWEQVQKEVEELEELGIILKE
jgi:hypothetical protein